MLVTRFGLAVFASQTHCFKQKSRLGCRRHHHLHWTMFYLSHLISLVVLCSTIRTITCENVENNAIRPRNSAPQFKAKSVIDDKFKDISLADYATRGQWVVLVNVLHLSRYNYRCLCVCFLTDGVIGAAQLIKLEVVCFNLIRFPSFPQLFYPYDYTFVCPVSLLD